MRRFFSIFLSLALILTASVLAAPTAFCDSAVSGETGDCQWSFDPDSGRIRVWGSGMMADYDSSTLTPWHDHRTQITSVVIEDGVTYVGKNCFNSCSENKYIELADTVTKVGMQAFSGSYSVTEIDLSQNLETVGYCAFWGLGVKELTLPRSLKSADGSAFHYSSIESLTIPDGCACTFASSFESCEKLKTVYIGRDAVISDRTFARCKSMTKFSVSPDHTSLSASNGHLFNKDKTKLIMYANGNGATTSSLSNAITELGDFAFSDNQTLTSITLSKNLKKIGAETFRGSKLESIVFTGSALRQVGSEAFDYTPWLRAQPEGLLYTGTVAYRYIGEAPETVALKEGILGVGDKCFIKQAQLKSIVLPGSLRHIGRYAFSECGQLDNVELPDGLESIDSAAFNKCTALSSLYIPDSVTSLGEMFLYGCSALKSVRLSESITEIPRWSLAFTGLEGDVMIPESVTKIGWAAFYHSNGAMTITIPNRSAVIESGDISCFGWNTTVRAYKNSPVYDYLFNPMKGIPFIPISEYIIGDVNGSGAVDNRDAVILDRYIVGWEGYENHIADMDAADLDRNGAVNNRDAVILDRYIGGWAGYDKYIITV